MKISERHGKMTGRQTTLLLGCLFALSCISLLSEGLGHLWIFLPLATMNILVGAFTSERVARAVLAAQVCAMVAAGGYMLVAYDIF